MSAPGQAEIRKDLHDLGGGLYAYVQHDGSWGWSNSGLIASGGQSLLVDTLFTLGLTREMLAAYRDACPEAAAIGTLVNTHANGDHTFGNQLVEGARILASEACLEEMEERPAEAFRAMMAGWEAQGEAGRFLHEMMGARFDFSGIRHTPPTETFSGSRRMQLGDLAVDLIEVGPAHTRGDVIVHVPERATVFTGDIVFHNGHPIIWAGPLSNWVAACDRIAALAPEVVVPGHGPITDLSTVRALRDYFTFIDAESRARHAAGMGWAEAAWDIALDAWDSWLDRERVVANVAAVYRELSGGAEAADRTEIIAMMGRYRAGARTPQDAPGCGCGDPAHRH